MMWKTAPVLLLLLILGGCRPQPSAVPARPPSDQPPVTSIGELADKPGAGSKVAWLGSLDDGLKQAQVLNRPVLIDFYAPWCGPCKTMDEEVWPDVAVGAAAANFVTVRLNVDEHKDESEKYNVESIPTVVFLDSTGKEVDRSVGLLSVDDLLELMKKHGAK